MSLKYKDYTYKDFKIEVSDKVVEFILNIQNKFYKYRSDEEYLKRVFEIEAQKARIIASNKMEEVK